MKCVVCKKAETKSRTTTVVLIRGELTVRIKNVPARVCPKCGEAYVEEKIAVELLRTTHES